MAKKTKKIYITESDRNRLLELIDRFRNNITKDMGNLMQLEQELKRAEIVEPQQIPKTVVTMNSKVKLLNTVDDSEMVFEVVYPDDADVMQDKVSIFAPLGTAVLGYRVGDEVEWKVPAGMRKFRIEQLLYQPEADAKDFS